MIKTQIQTNTENSRDTDWPRGELQKNTQAGEGVEGGQGPAQVKTWRNTREKKHQADLRDLADPGEAPRSAVRSHALGPARGPRAPRPAPGSRPGRAGTSQL